MSDSYDKERLGKIVALAKNGTGGEKENAIRIVRKICAEYGLDFDAVMEDVQLSDYEISYTHSYEEALLAQVVQKYGRPNQERKMDILHSRGAKKMWITTTKEAYVETLNAWDVLRKLYRKERSKAMEIVLFAFLDKHELYYVPTKEELEDPEYRAHSKMDAEELDLRRRGSSLARHMEDAKLHRRLGPGSK